MEGVLGDLFGLFVGLGEAAAFGCGRVDGEVFYYREIFYSGEGMLVESKALRIEVKKDLQVGHGYGYRRIGSF